MASDGKSSSDGKAFLQAFFSKLKNEDFEEKETDPDTGELVYADKFLKAFIDAYTAEIKTIVKNAKNEKRTLKAADLPTRFSFYIEYIIRNKFTDPYERDVLRDYVCNEITSYILDPPKDDFEIINRPVPTVERKNVIAGKPDEKELEQRVNKMAMGHLYSIVSSNTDDQRRIQHLTIPKNECAINKTLSMKILSLYIQRSFITRESTGDADAGNNETIQQCKQMFTSNLETEIELSILAKERPPLPPPVKDREFARRNELQAHWRIVKMSCDLICQNEYARKKVSYVDVVDGETIKLDAGSKITTSVFQNYEDILPGVEHICKWKQIHQMCKLVFHHKNYMQVTHQLSQEKKKFALVCSASSMVGGGNSDQGIVTNETALYHTSTYNIPINRLYFVYPIKSTFVFHIPYVFVFQKVNTNESGNLEGFEEIPDKYGMPVIVSNVAFRPKTSLVDQSSSDYDPRLRENSTMLASPNMYRKHVEAMFLACIFFGYSEIVIDDHCLDAFWYPTYCTIQLFCDVMQKYITFFSKIHVAIEDKSILDAFVDFMKK